MGFNMSHARNGGKMDSSFATYLLAAALVVILGISYIRFKKGEGENGSQRPSADIKQTLSEMRDYFGLTPKQGKKSAVDAFDLAPMQVLSELSGQSSNRKPGRAKTGRKG